MIETRYALLIAICFCFTVGVTGTCTIQMNQQAHDRAIKLQTLEGEQKLERIKGINSGCKCQQS